MAKKYYDSLNIKNIERLRKNIKKLPPFVSEFFLSIANTTSIYTRLGYSYDLKLFFDYLINEEPEFYKESLRDFTFDDFKKINTTHIREFLEYLSYYLKDLDSMQLEVTNDSSGKSRKLSAIRSLFLFFIQEEKITYNPAVLVKTPKVQDKNIIYLDVNEVADLLDEIDSGEKLTDRQKAYHDKTRKRDLALVMSLLGTGMRISECIGLDISKVDFDNASFSIVRKGGKESFVYFNYEVMEALLDYLEERKTLFLNQNQKSDKSTEQLDQEFREQPLFTSLQNRRINARTVQNLVKKYSRIATPLKNISPHKLRSTYGTNLYNESNDIYLVADALGHADINTTKKHYANMADERRRASAKYTKLR